MAKSLRPFAALCLISLFFAPVIIHAQYYAPAKVSFPELTELDYDTLEMQNNLPDETVPRADTLRLHLKLETRHNWKPSQDQLTNRIIISPYERKASSAPHVYAIEYQKLDKHDNPINFGQIGLFLGYKKYLKTLALGNYSLQAGEGLCLGAYNPSARRQSLYIHPNYNLSHPALNGFAAEIYLLGFSWVAWLSQSERIATTTGQKITRLYESNLTDTDNKDKVQQGTHGLIADFKGNKGNLGAYWYSQEFSLEFADSTYVPLKNAYGIFASYLPQPFSIYLEAGMADKKTAKAIKLGYDMSPVYHTLQYIYRPDVYPMSFSRTEQVFGQKTGSEELGWDVRYRLSPKWAVSNRIAMVRDLASDADSRWKERQILTLENHAGNHNAGLAYYRFRKDAVPFSDTLVTEILPTQHRLKAFWRQEISKPLSYKVTCQYQHYLDQKWTKNGFSMQHALQFNYAKTGFGVAYTSWVNQKSLYQPVDLPSDDELLVMGDSDSAFRIYFKRSIGDSFSVNLNAYRPLHKVSRQSLGLNLQAQI
jgi:hypothetical protein